MSEADQFRHQMVVDLMENGRVKSAAWRGAFERVPRHALIPRCYDYDETGKLIEISGADPDHRQQWLAMVYRPDLTVLIECRGGMKTSTATMPSIIAEHLEELKVDDGDEVLEIGTGSGYSTALLCERLGDERVTSMDVSVDLVDSARQRLAAAGHRPTLIVGDGYDGWPKRAPYDRLLAEVQVARIPRPWLRQVRPGGRIVAVMPRNLVRMVANEDGSASGTFSHRGNSFIRLRGHEPVVGAEEIDALLAQKEEGSYSQIDLKAFLNDNSQGPFGMPGWHDWWDLFRVIYLPFDRALWPAEGDTAIVDLRTRSWVWLDPDQQAVWQGGSWRIWDAAEAFYELFCNLGRPTKDRFGLTVRPDGSQCVWLDDPSGEHRWELVPDRPAFGYN